MDMLSMGPDCARHGFLGCIIANNGTPPEQQARNFLLSLRLATIHEVAGRAGDLSHAEYLELLRQLSAWEAAGNTVKLPPRVTAADHPLNHIRR
jgi:hypothetical protein